jgi:DNA (cytosine-5)-methyltransferase 1
VDFRPQPRYPFEFHQGDALEFLAAHGGEFDAIHASPPCQAHTAINHARKGRLESLVDPTRDALESTKKPWVIENVPGAPLRGPIKLCGTMFGLAVIRHRLFESSALLLAPGRCRHAGSVADGTYVSVHGGGQRSTHTIPYAEQRPRWEQAMGIDWMGTRDELCQAIPPAYTEFIGLQLLKFL